MFNTYWLDADNRGCESCHADLDALFKNMAYEHYRMTVRAKTADGMVSPLEATLLFEVV